MLSTFIDCGVFYLVLNIIIMLAYYSVNRMEENGLFGFISMLFFGAPLVVFATILVLRYAVKNGGSKNRTTEEKVDAIVYSLQTKRKKKHDDNRRANK